MILPQALHEHILYFVFNHILKAASFYGEKQN